MDCCSPQVFGRLHSGQNGSGVTLAPVLLRGYVRAIFGKMLKNPVNVRFLQEVNGVTPNSHAAVWVAFNDDPSLLLEVHEVLGCIIHLVLPIPPPVEG